MNRKKGTIISFILLAVFIGQVPAQTNINTNTNTNTASTVFDTTGFPQWAKDLRRWEIVAFGSFPFTMFTATFAMDMYRWSNANGLDFSAEGRRYAPWPLKSSGAVAMESDEMGRTILLAAGLSVTIAVIDQIIVQVKRHKARKRAESLPAGTTIITTKPWPGEAPPEENSENSGNEDTPAGQP